MLEDRRARFLLHLPHMLAMLVLLATCPGEVSGEPYRLFADVSAAVRFSREEAARLGDHPERIDGLGVAARASAIDLLMRGTTGSREERTILEVLRRTPPVDRARLLRRIDQGDDHYDVVKLLFDDIDDASRRRAALALAREAEEAFDDAGLLELGIVSDVDDTAIPTDFRPDGRDAFAGAGAFYRDLELGPDGSGTAGDIHFVTGRPPIAAGDVRDRLRTAGIPAGTLATGDLGEVLLAGPDGIAREKIRDLERLLSLHPRQRFVFLGDDRQRDPEVYREIRARHPTQVAGIYIHRAGGDTRVPAAFPGTVFFDRYDEL